MTRLLTTTALALVLTGAAAAHDLRVALPILTLPA